VILRWPDTFAAATSSSMSGAVSYQNTGGYHYYTFTGTGLITWTNGGDSGTLVL
jgi:hypothetical protein